MAVTLFPRDRSSVFDFFFFDFFCSSVSFLSFISFFSFFFSSFLSLSIECQGLLPVFARLENPGPLLLLPGLPKAATNAATPILYSPATVYSVPSLSLSLYSSLTVIHAYTRTTFPHSFPSSSSSALSSFSFSYIFVAVVSVAQHVELSSLARSQFFLPLISFARRPMRRAK